MKQAKKKLINKCGHSTMRNLSSNLQTGECGKEYNWCLNCGALMVTDIRRNWLNTLERGKFKTIRPKNHYNHGV